MAEIKRIEIEDKPLDTHQALPKVFDLSIHGGRHLTAFPNRGAAISHTPRGGGGLFWITVINSLLPLSFSPKYCCRFSPSEGSPYTNKKLNLLPLSCRMKLWKETQRLQMKIDDYFLSL
jgi:hypothetical protein